MIVQKLHWKGQPRPASKVTVDCDAPHDLGRQERHLLAAQVGEVFHEVIDGPQPPVVGIAQELLHPPFGFAGEEGDALLLEGPQFGGQFGQHRQAAADVKAAHDHGDGRRAELPCQVGGPRELVGLHPGQQNQAASVRRLNPANDPPHGDHRIRLVVGIHHDVDVIAQYPPFSRGSGPGRTGTPASWKG